MTGATPDSAVYTYDNNGNLLMRIGAASGSTGYGYDLFNRQVQATISGVTAKYTYDPRGIRTGKRVGAASTIFLLDGDNVSVESQGDAIAASYLWGINPKAII